MKLPLVSLIIPVYNRETLIKTTLDSVFQQTYTNWECIVVDDGSTDNTITTLKAYEEKDNRIQIIQRPNRISKGANACRNYGFAFAKGNYINWFDSDDVMKPHFLQEKIEAFSETVDAVLHRNKYANYILTRFRDSKFEYDNNESLFYNYAMEHIEVQTSGFMWRRSFLEQKMLFDETIARYQDNEFHIRMLALRPNVKIINTILATIRGGDGDVSQISSKANLSKKKLYDIFYYRYQCLKLAQDNDFHFGKTFNKTITKKALWSFYTGLKFETNFLKKTQDILKFKGKLKFIYGLKEVTLLDILKSHLNILKIMINR